MVLPYGANSTIEGEHIMDLTQKLTGTVIPVNASVQVTGHKSREFSLSFDYSDCTIADVLRKAASEDRIAWQNNNRAKGEEHMSKLPISNIVKAKPPGVRGPIDIEAAYLSKMGAASVDDLDAQIAKLTALKTSKTETKSEVKQEKPSARPGREAR
jgi:hypothetical protein